MGFFDMVEVTKFNDEDLKQAEDIVGRFGLDAQLLYILSQGIPETYKPRKKVLTMSVGGGNHLKEGSLIRGFHGLRFGIDPDSVKTICCDIEFRPEGLLYSSESDYDLELRGSDEGDATSLKPWLKGLDFNGEGIFYDFVHINYPDYVNFSEWESIFLKSLEFLSDTGIVTTISGRSKDGGKLRRMHRELTEEFGILATPMNYYHYDPDGGIIDFFYSFAGFQKRKIGPDY